LFEHSQIVICKDIDTYLEEILETLDIHYTRVFKASKDSFLIDEARDVIKEAYTSSDKTKYIFICAKTFRIEAQNSLLKILEEPPRNTIFIIVTNSKSVLLPTIHSRLQLSIHDKPEKLQEIEFDFYKLDLAFFINFVNGNKYISKNDSKDYLQALFLNISQNKIRLDEYELEKFSNAFKMIELNSRPINVLTSILLMLLHKRFPAKR
jgi:DNA polymerase-3 subunit delta'